MLCSCKVCVCVRVHVCVHVCMHACVHTHSHMILHTSLEGIYSDKFIEWESLIVYIFGI